MTATSTGRPSVAELQLGLRRGAAALTGHRVDLVVAGSEPRVGCSVTALLLADVMAASGRQVRLVELAPRSGSGLVAASTAELGPDETGQWLRGRRSAVEIWRRADDAQGQLPEAPSQAFLVLDAGAARGVAGPCVLVARGTGAGLDAAEGAMHHLTREPVAIAAIGPRRWRPSVRANCGPALRRFLDAGRVVPVPVNGSLQAAGLTSAPLPRTLLIAGGKLTRLIDAAQEAR